MYYEHYTSTLIFSFIVGALLALIPAKIAGDKGRSFGLWWVYGFFLWLIALIHAAVIEKPPERYYEREPLTVDKKEPDKSDPPIIVANQNILADQTQVNEVHFPSNSFSNITCPICRKVQMPNRSSCYSCGTRFVYDDADSFGAESDTINEADVADTVSPELKDFSQRFCHKCGKLLPAMDSKYCHMCGAKVVRILH